MLHAIDKLDKLHAGKLRGMWLSMKIFLLVNNEYVRSFVICIRDLFDHFHTSSGIWWGTNPPPSVFAATGTPRLIQLALDSVSTTTAHADSLPTNKSSLGVWLQSG